MPITRAALRNWTPDLDEHVIGANGASSASGCLPEPEGFSPIALLLNQATTVLEGRPRGVSGPVYSSSFADSPANFVGTHDKLYQIHSIAADFTDRSLVAYGLTGSERWDFAQFYDIVVAVAPGVNPQSKNIWAGGNFANLAVGAAPLAKCCAAVDQHIVLGDVLDMGGWGLGTMNNAVWWSGRGNPATWLQPGTTAAISAQTDYRQLTGEGGEVMAIVSVENTGYVLQRKAIWRMDYVGGSVMFEFTKVVDGNGCKMHHAAKATPQGVFFVDEDGLYFFDGAGARLVAESRFNQWFVDNQYSGAQEWTSLAVDPDFRRIYVLFPNDASAYCTNLLCYDWANDVASMVTVAHNMIGQMRLTETDLTEVVCFDSNHDLSRFTSATAVDCEIKTGRIELNPGGRAFLQKVRPVVKGGGSCTMTLKVGTANEADEDLTWSGWISEDSWGEFPASHNAKYHEFHLKITGNVAHWDRAMALDLQYEPAGRY
jgi:hypothetical protein